MSNTDKALVGIDTAIGLIQFLLDQEAATQAVATELAKRFAARVDMGERWTAADTASFSDWLKQLDDQAKGS
jgi:hypothetical protein